MMDNCAPSDYIKVNIKEKNCVKTLCDPLREMLCASSKGGIDLLCIGSDTLVEDCFGPLAGSLLLSLIARDAPARRQETAKRENQNYPLNTTEKTAPHNCATPPNNAMNRDNLRIHGNLFSPLTALNTPYLADRLCALRPNGIILVVDSALSDSFPPGTLLLSASPARLLNGRLLGDISFLGLTGPLSENPYEKIGLSTVYEMAKVASECLFTLLKFTPPA